eukprot:m.165080 g.165080  ORF g.165080 m.165080 type:complete len:155 (+) comp21072_c0_seq1:42-506(+)
MEREERCSAENGKFHGLATFFSSAPADPSAAVFVFPDGSVYEGQVDNVDGRPVRKGQGVLRLADGSKMTGQWKSDLLHGRGRCEFADGSVYEGQWCRHAFDGEGTLTSASGVAITGRWAAGKLTGPVQSKDEQGVQWVGQMADHRGCQLTVMRP